MAVTVLVLLTAVAALIAGAFTLGACRRRVVIMPASEVRDQLEGEIAALRQALTDAQARETELRRELVAAAGAPQGGER